MRFLFASLVLMLFIRSGLQAQEVLPQFNATVKGAGKVLISWKNTYSNINQISIQRSNDSLRNFTTVLTVPDPRLAENGFVDIRATGTKVFYRMFILFGNSRYIFTKSRRATTENPGSPVVKTESPVPVEKIPEKPVAKTDNKKGKPGARGKQVLKGKTENPVAIQAEKPVENPVVVTQPPVNEKQPVKPAADSTEDDDLDIQKIDNARIFYPIDPRPNRAPSVNSPGKITVPTIRVDRTLAVMRRDSLIRRLAATRVRFFSDSLMKMTHDTLLFVNADTLLIRPYIAPVLVQQPKVEKEVFKPSQNVFTAKDGNVTISLPDFETKNYSVKFFEDDNTPVIELKEINNGVLTVDKTNFMHSGWFRFELYEEGKLKEKNRFFIPRDL